VIEEGALARIYDVVRWILTEQAMTRVLLLWSHRILGGPAPASGAGAPGAP